MVLAARGVLPAWRTAPTASVLRDAGLPSGSTALEHARIRFALRLRTLDAAHPLVRRLETPILPWQRATKLRCADTLIPHAPRPVLAQPHFSPGCRTDPTEGSTEEAAAEQFNTWWSQLSDNTITVFSDGSEQYKDGAKLVGYGYAIYRGQSLVRTGSGAINSISHVFDAEAIGALKGLQCALEILRPLDEHMDVHRQHFGDLFKVGIRWSPGHMGIEGNETADELADAGANEGRMDDDRSAEPTISGIGTTARALADAVTSDWWSRCLTGLSASYRKWGLGYSIAEPPELRLPRTLLHRLLAARTAHGDFAQYHRRFGHTDAELNCLCGYAKTPEHLVFCEISQRKFHAWPAKPERPPSRPKEGRRPAIGDSRIRTRQAAIRTPFKNDRQSALASESFEAGNTKTWTRSRLNKRASYKNPAARPSHPRDSTLEAAPPALLDWLQNGSNGRTNQKKKQLKPSKSGGDNSHPRTTRSSPTDQNKPLIANIVLATDMQYIATALK
ncbi:hypothetical protein DID88_003047 [Monilinia fructigena]|uniref:Uncharacterized protein n=1 Tax=Monilinia fructigena TaxID=38457 RepID=A0A395IEZ5_9HELO|nr:hypothetical protein DID88_003047 [Monilinia fructigena]